MKEVVQSFEKNWNKTARNIDFNKKEQVQSCLGWRAVLELFKIQGFGLGRGRGKIVELHMCLRFPSFP